jgi:PQQ-dependent dehydrogenase (methanol/ethanol family)
MAGQARACCTLAVLLAACRSDVTRKAVLDSTPAAGGAADDWAMIGGDYAATRYSPLTEIDSTNLGRLEIRTRSPFDQQSLAERVFGVSDSQRVWYRPRTWRLQPRRWLGASERQTSTPVVVDGVAYFTGSYNRVLAVEVATGRQRWVYRHHMERVPLVCCGPHNRGVAVAGDRVYVGTLDARLVALDRAAGRPVWDVAVGDPAASYSITAAPLVVDDLVLIGVSGGEYGIRGFLAAFDARTGAPRWRFWTVPSPAEGGWWGRWSRVTPDGDSLPRDIDREKRDSARYPETWQHGGAPVWMTPAYDTATGVLYVGTGNPAPALDDTPRPGDNLFGCSILALDARTGALRWYFQLSPHDLWDRDASNPIELFSLRLGDSVVPALAQANKTGRVYVLDRRNGRLLVRSDPFVPVKDMFARPTTAGTVMYPAVGGGNVSAPSAYWPAGGLLIVPGVHRPTRLRLDAGTLQPGRSYYGGQDASAGGGWGNISAIELATGRVRWQHRTEVPPVNTGALVTASGLLLYGDGTSLVAADVATGRVLRRLEVGCRIDGTPVTFLEGGRQRLALVCRAGLLTFGLAGQA